MRLAVDTLSKSLSGFLYRLLFKHFYGYIGKNVRIYSPLPVVGKNRIFLYDNVTIEYNSWLAAKPLTGASDCRLEIGEGTSIGHFNHIYATKSIVMGKNVLTADKVYISDNAHGYKDINTPIKHQPVEQKKGVVIGDGSWLGENVCVIGASIGKQCVIGANSVVTHDIPDYCVAVGAPAKVIKRYNEKPWIYNSKK